MLETHARLGDATAVVDASAIGELARFARDDGELDFDMLSDLTAVDYLRVAASSPDRGPGNTAASRRVDAMERCPSWGRFEVVYHLYSIARRQRLRVKVRLREK